MIKLIFCASRKPELSIADFRKSWEEVHVPVFAEFARMTGAQRHVHSLTLAVDRNLELMLTQGTREPYDGVSEVWWPNAQDLQAALATPVVQNLRDRLFHEGSKFIDHDRSTLFYTQEEAE